MQKIDREKTASRKRGKLKLAYPVNRVHELLPLDR